MSVNLTKWPAMVVVGDSVTPKQAAEIIVKTDQYIRFPSSNERSFDKLFHRLFNMPYDGYGGDSDKLPDIKDDGGAVLRAIWEANGILLKQLGILDLEYLTNRQICSSWIGGAHGWCHWDGTIFSNNYNIGKYPSVDSVKEEWELIVSTFPYLNLRCQLMNGETCCENLQPVVEFVVSDGHVEVKEDGFSDLVSISNKHFTDVYSLMYERHEAGIVISSLKEKLLEMFNGKIPQFQCTKYKNWLKNQ